LLRIGAWLMSAAGLLIAGYAVYWLVRLLVFAPGISVFFKVAILVGGIGLLITLVGLIMERRKEAEDASSDD